MIKKKQRKCRFQSITLSVKNSFDDNGCQEMELTVFIHLEQKINSKRTRTFVNIMTVVL